MKNVTIYDTTLRDGMQGTGISFTLKDKMDIAHKLDDMGFDYIEGGFPLANEKEKSFFKRVRQENFNHSKIVAFGSTRRPDTTAAKDPNTLALLNAETSTAIIVGKSWLSHVTQVIKTNPEQNLEMIYDSISFLKKEGREVFFDLEHFFDGYKDDPEYAKKVLKTGTEAGADCLVLCDTNGGVLPMESYKIIKELSSMNLAPMGAHFHNDTGTAVACSLLAVEAGANHIQGTINGWGERCGNANLLTIIPNLDIKMSYNTSIRENLSQLTDLSRYVYEKANIIPDKNQPFVGTAAFSHKAGQHVDVIQKNPKLIEHMESSVVGNERKVLLSELSGKSTIVKKLAKYGNFDKNSKEVARLITLLKTRESNGYEYEAAEGSFDLIIRKALNCYKPLLQLNNYHLESYKSRDVESKTVGRVFLHAKGLDFMGAAVDNGPVGTLDHAIRDALSQTYPFLNNISLIDYRVRVLNPEDATEAKVRVFITTSDNKHSWDTVGVSENIIEASWDALVDSMEYYYNNFIVE